MGLVCDASVEITFARAQRSDCECAVEMFGNCPGMKKEYKPAPKFLPKGLYLSENANIEMLNDKLSNWIYPGKSEWIGCEDDIY